MDKKAYYQQNREHILQLHKEWRDAHPPSPKPKQPQVYCIACKMNYPVNRLEKHKATAMHVKELAEYCRLQSGLGLKTYHHI